MSERKKHIAFICSRLDVPGGIERAVVNTANLFAENNHPVTLIILDNYDKSFYPIHPAVNIKQSPLTFGITENGNMFSRKFQFLKDVKKQKTLLKEINADVYIATEYPFAITAILAGAKQTSKVYSWEHHHYNWLKKSFFWKTMFNRCYRKLDGIICLNKTEAAHFRQYAPATVIPNFIENKSGNRSSCTEKTILSVGWLIHRKGIDLMMQAAKEVLNKNPDWKWKIIGDGEMKNQLLDFIQKENLQEKLIVQQPESSAIANEYLSASLFVLSSRFEAFPMVLLEAMSFGVPCISTDCPTGPSDIISNNDDGILIKRGNPGKLGQAVHALIQGEALRKKMGEKAFTNIQRFSPKMIYPLWEKIV